MAKNWTMAEAVQAIANGDAEAVMELGKRFPLMTTLVAKAVSGDGNAVVKLFASIPEYLTANKVQTALKNAIGAEDEVEDEEEEQEEKQVKKPAKKATKKVEEEPEEDEEDDEEEATDDYESMNGGKLYEMCKERGILKKCKTKKKADLIAALREDDAAGGVDDAEDEEEDADEYSDMSVQELFKECKKRGIKAPIKKPAKFYIDLLKKDDAAVAEEDTDDEDWGEEEEEEKSAPKKSQKASKSKAKAKDDDEDDDDDWDI